MPLRVTLFLVLSLLIIFSYPYFLEKFVLPAPEAKKEQKGAPSGTTSSSTPTPAPLAPLAAAPPEASVQVAETFKVVESDLYRIVLSSRGGSIAGWELKRYTTKDTKGAAQPIQLFSPNGTLRPLTVTVPEGTSSQETAFFPYSLDPAPLQLNKERPIGTVVMKAVWPDGRSITKEITFHHNQYHADLALRVEGFSKGYRLSLGSNFGITDWNRQLGGGAGAIQMVDGKILSEHPGVKTVTYEEGAAWFGLQDKYFISALIPHKGGNARGRRIVVEGHSPQELSTSMEIPSNKKESDRFILYAGPKEYDRLASYRTYLEEAIDFGWFIYGSWLPVRWVAKPLFYILRFLYDMTQNYGFAIILLTVLIKLAFYPITKKSVVSMKRMAALQPQVEAIRKRWASNREKMNRELMTLFREGGANPAGGCLPLLLQMPVFIALFNILYITIDLREAPFILWIADLSSKDPYYVLPILMGVTLLLQMKMQPTTMDPLQAKMMTFLMPAFSTFLSLRFPSGLVLYWLVNNLLSAAQQYFLNMRAL